MFSGGKDYGKRNEILHKFQWQNQNTNFFLTNYTLKTVVMQSGDWINLPICSLSRPARHF